VSSELPLAPGPTDAKDPSRARAFRNYLIGGLLVWIPILITFWVLRFLSGILDQSLLLLPPSWRPEAVFGTYVPGVGVVLSLLLLFFTGLLVKNLFGSQIVRGLESLVRRIPVIGVGFITSEQSEEVQARTAEEVLCVFVPTTPNPTTGFLVMIPRNEVTPLDMSVDEAFKMLLTLGVVVPKWRNRPPVAANLAVQQDEP
jgi:uncharacterized membrane protein